MYFHRAQAKYLQEAACSFPVILLTGCRQAGKSTLLTHVFPDHAYLTLDDLVLRQQALEDPALFLQMHPGPIIIDEIQYAPDLLIYIKIAVDKNRHQYGQFILTGSQTFSLMAGVSESLAGRVAVMDLYPMHWKEISAIPGNENIVFDDAAVVRQMIQGFYPEFLVNPDMNANIWFNSYLNTYIERDIRHITYVQDLSTFRLFLGLLAARVGQLVNMSEIAKEAGISQPTVKAWISLLSSTYIIHLLQPYQANISKRLVKMPKLYFVDTGILCHLLGIDSQERFLNSPFRGEIFENMVIMDQLKQASNHAHPHEFFFYRTSNGVEIDLLIQVHGAFHAREIKFSKKPIQKMTRALTEFQSIAPCHSAAVLNLYEMNLPLTSSVWAKHWYESID
jgi:predicted AAA+ superfamily ATPase